MIHVCESWTSIVARLGVGPLRKGRAQCPFCQSRSGFSCSDDKGCFHCFACDLRGDKITFVRQLTGWGFVDALQFFGQEPGRPPAPDPDLVRLREIKRGLKFWAGTLGRELRYEHYIRECLIRRARERLVQDADDEWAWNWLGWALTGLEKIAYQLDQLEGCGGEQLALYITLRGSSS